MKILNYLNKKFMAFRDIFKDKNDLNEKSIIGFMSFAVMVLFATADLITGYLGKDLVVQEFIYNSFLVITLGCFGIAGVEKIFTKKDKSEENRRHMKKKFCTLVTKLTFGKVCFGWCVEPIEPKKEVKKTPKKKTAQKKY